MADLGSRLACQEGLSDWSGCLGDPRNVGGMTARGIKPWTRRVLTSATVCDPPRGMKRFRAVTSTNTDRVSTGRNYTSVVKLIGAKDERRPTFGVPCARLARPTHELAIVPVKV